MIKKYLYLASTIVVLLLLSSCAKDKLNSYFIEPSVGDLVLNHKGGIHNFYLNDEIKYNPLKKFHNKSFAIAKNKIVAPPVVVGDVIYTIDTYGNVRAVSLSSKKMLWSNNIINAKNKNIINGGSILYNSHKLYIASGTRDLVILDAENGYEIMRKEFFDVIYTKPLLVSDNVIVVQTVSNQLVAYDLENLQAIWRHEGLLETVTIKNDTYPILYKNHVIVSNSSGQMCCIDLANGKQKWAYNFIDVQKVFLPNMQITNTTTQPILDGDYLYLSTSTGKLVKLDLLNGNATWTKEIADIQDMKLDNDVLFITTLIKKVAAIDKNNGDVIWIGDITNTASSKKDSEKLKKSSMLLFKPFITKYTISEKDIVKTVAKSKNIKKINMSANTESVTNESLDADTLNKVKRQADIDDVGAERLALNVPASNGNIYIFVTDNSGKFYDVPIIQKIKNNLFYYWLSCDYQLYLFTDKLVYY